MRFVASDMLLALVAKGTLSTGMDRDKIIIAQPEDLSALETLQANCKVLDYRRTARKKGSDGVPHGRLKLKRTVAIMLHQTAADIADEERLLNIPSHMAVSDEAHAVLLHPLNAYLYHGHGANRFALSIEVVCRADGVDGDARTFWRGKKEIHGYKRKSGVWVPPKQRAQLRREATDAQIVTTQHVIRYLCEAVREMAEAAGVEVEIKVIMAHRNSARKSADPGSRLWKGAGEWAIAELGLEEGPVIGKGSPLPYVWTGRGTEPYNWKVSGLP